MKIKSIYPTKHGKVMNITIDKIDYPYFIDETRLTRIKSENGIANESDALLNDAIISGDHKIVNEGEQWVNPKTGETGEYTKTQVKFNGLVSIDLNTKTIVMSRKNKMKIEVIDEKIKDLRDDLLDDITGML